ncbi:hypothetical protein C6Y45_10000 [Alkalicoccus saliphilus]|uniref:ATP-grasp domain-containing protein n=2 Tax=Alkalicoccus saliphilus TaxID=200989 RepID=A0A2T4U5Q4_9BACI|nr:hypothetical protein C6Y45_10000 [Alkalicoccus saliphilus]
MHRRTRGRHYDQAYDQRRRQGMKGWLIYKEEDRKRNKTFISWLQEAGFRRGMQLDVVTYETLAVNLSGDGPMFTGRTKPDFLIVRSSTPWLNEAAEMHGLRVFNPSCVSRTANDKRLSHALMSSIGVPMLTSTAVHRNNLQDIVPVYPFILKDPRGRGGTGVEWISRPQQIGPALKEELLMQPVGGQRGKDLRVYIVGGRIVGSVLRESETNFKANISIGGTASLYDLTDTERDVVEKITSSLSLDFAGIDFLIHEDGTLLFNEIEDAVGCRSLYMNSSIDIADVFIGYVAEQMA